MEASEGGRHVLLGWCRRPQGEFVWKQQWLQDSGAYPSARQQVRSEIPTPAVGEVWLGPGAPAGPQSAAPGPWLLTHETTHLVAQHL